MRDKQCTRADLAGRCEGRRSAAAAIEQCSICSIRKADPLSHRVKAPASDARILHTRPTMLERQAQKKTMLERQRPTRDWPPAQL